MKNKTLATWLSFWGGPLGLHRFYMFGKSDWLAWVLPWPTLLGLYGNSNWLTVAALVLSLLVGTTALLSTLAFGFQRYFESQIEEARKISQ